MSETIMDQIHERTSEYQKDSVLLQSFRDDVEASIKNIKNDIDSNGLSLAVVAGDYSLINEAMDLAKLQLMRLYLRDEPVSAIALTSAICKLVEPRPTILNERE